MKDTLTSDPATLLADLKARAQRVETPCGDGAMVWRIWRDDNLPALVLAHGAQGSWNHWVRNIERLSQHRRLIVADLPGHVDSAMPDGEDHKSISQALAQGLETILGAGGLPVRAPGFSCGRGLRGTPRPVAALAERPR